MFYYDYWRPYIVRDADSPAKARPAKVRAKAAVSESSRSVFLNKSLNQKTVGFAQDVYKSVVSLKEASRITQLSADRFERRERSFGAETAKEYLSDGLSDFAEAYNKASGFLPLQDHSPSLVGFFDETDDAISAGRGELERLGLKIGEDGKMSFDANKLNSLTPRETKEAADAARPIFTEIYDSSLSVMKMPLTEHMDFRSFRYYYNYQTGITKQDTFSAMGTGTMVDIAL